MEWKKIMGEGPDEFRHYYVLILKGGEFLEC